MQHVNQVLDNPLPSEPTSKPSRYEPSVTQKRLVSALWTRMTQLYRWKWEKSEGPMLVGPTGQQVYSEQFLLWCRKTDQLTPAQWKKGFASIEKLIDAERAEGKEPFPPSYHDFVTLAKGISPGGSNATAYLDFNDPRHPEYEHYGRKRLPDDAATERNRAANRKSKSLIDAMFGAAPDQENGAEDAA